MSPVRTQREDTMASIRLVFWNPVSEIEELEPAVASRDMYIVTGRSSLGWFHGLAEVKDLAPLLFPSEPEATAP